MLTFFIVFLYLLAMLAIGLWVSKAEAAKSKVNFVSEYFLGGRGMGAFVFAMTVICTYTSGSSFVGGPGTTYDRGFGWMLMAVANIPVMFYTLGIIGKKLAIVSRRVNAVTVTDYLYARYQSNFVSFAASISMIIFFVAIMIAQFVAGARLFEAVTGYSYVAGLAIFGLMVVVYTAVGGFRAVVITDAVQGVIMLGGTFLLLFSLNKLGGGLDAIMDNISAQGSKYLDPIGEGAVPPLLLLSQMFMVGFATLGLPQTAVRCMGYKDCKSLHRAMIIGTPIIGVLLFGMHFAGGMARAVLTETPASPDLVIPIVVTQLFHPILAGLLIAGPLAAVMSTVDSLLIMVSADLIKNMYIKLNPSVGDETIPENEKKLKKISVLATFAIGIAVFVLAINPPTVIIWINNFAFGGLEIAFLMPVVMGLFWRKANRMGVITSIVVSVTTYIIVMSLGVSLNGMHNIMIGLVTSVVFFFIGNAMGRDPDAKTQQLFFGKAA